MVGSSDRGVVLTDETYGDPSTEEVEPDEFEQIARLYRPLTDGAPEALDLLDDVAVLPGRPGFDLVITKDAMVQGVHFLPDEPLDRVARKLLRTNLSDLAAKGAEPHGYLLALAWPPDVRFADRRRFADGLAQDQALFGVRLLGGDTVSTPGPLTASMTMLGWTPSGELVKRSGARVGDVVLVSGTIGDAGLGLRALAEGLTELAPEAVEVLAGRHRLPVPRLALRAALRGYATAAVDVSDGLLADAGHIARASGVAISVALERTPLSPAAEGWVALQPDRLAALLFLAAAGDDYEVLCTVRNDRVDAIVALARQAGVSLSVIGTVTAQSTGVSASLDGRQVKLDRLGWTHR